MKTVLTVDYACSDSCTHLPRTMGIRIAPKPSVCWTLSLLLVRSAVITDRGSACLSLSPDGTKAMADDMMPAAVIRAVYFIA